MAGNRLYYGDNLAVLRQYIRDEVVDLVYIDPPFNSNANYNILFKEQNGARSAGQIKAFTDTWRWDESANETFDELVARGGKVALAMAAFRQLLGTSDMLAYLAMMAPRLVELHRVLKPTGSFYLHCDPAASHYLKILLDALFGPGRFRSEIVWKRSTAHNDTKQGRQQHGHIHDVLLYYTKGDDWTWNPTYTPYDVDYIEDFYRHIDAETGRRYRLSDLTAAKPGGDTNYEWRGVKPYKGRYWAYSRENMERFEREGRLYYSKNGMPSYKRYLDEMPGVALQDLWTDIRPVGAQAAERLGYATQKPVALLERIIESSSNPGDVVLDAFCGCGTAVAAAQALDRRWVGIDITYAAIRVIRNRLDTTFGVGTAPKPIGEPRTIDDAAVLAKADPYQFQWWALGLVGGRPTEEKKGADQGVDGRLAFDDEDTGLLKEVVFSVKAGAIPSNHLRELRGVIEREGAAIGALIAFREPTSAMKKEAASAGTYLSPRWGRRYPRLQIITVAELLAGKQLQCPPLSQVNRTLPKAPRHKRPPDAYQRSLPGTALVPLGVADDAAAMPTPTRVGRVARGRGRREGAG